MGTILDVINENLAESNIDIAIDQLSGLLRNDPNKLKRGVRKYCSQLNQYSKYINLRVWSDSIPIKRVKQEIIPLLEKAYQKVTSTGKYFRNIRTTMKWRKEELEQMYCNGLDPCLPEWVTEKIRSY